MKQQNIILTSMLAIIIASPAMATVGDTVNAENPAMCTVGDLGVSSGTANATAQYSINSYTCAAGTYLPSGTSWTTDTQYTNNNCAPCPANSYCPGSGNAQFTYSESSDQGITTCSSKTGGAYPYSDAGTYNVWGNEDNEGLLGCYNNVTCPTISAATACDPHAATCAYANSAVTSGRLYANGRSDLQCTLDFTCATGYTKSTTQTAPTLPSASTYGDDCQYRSHNGQEDNNSDNDLSAGEWKVSWTSGATQGTIKGIASCNSIVGRNNDRSWANPSTLPANTNLISNSADANDSSRHYCWCKPTSWTPSGGAEQSLSAAWVFNNDYGDASYCADGCASQCANELNDGADFRSALFGVVGASIQCVANTITLNWNNENGTQFTSGSCTYDETLTVPSTHPDKRGYTFTGWRFASQN